MKPENRSSTVRPERSRKSTSEGTFDRALKKAIKGTKPIDDEAPPVPTRTVKGASPRRADREHSKMAANDPHCRAALQLVRATIEEYCPPAVLPSEEYINGRTDHRCWPKPRPYRRRSLPPSNG